MSTISETTQRRPFVADAGLETGNSSQEDTCASSADSFLRSVASVAAAKKPAELTAVT